MYLIKQVFRSIWAFFVWRWEQIIKPNWAINVCKLTINIGQNIRRYMKVKINNSETGRRKKWSEIFRAGKYIIIGGKEKLRRKKDFF